MIAGLIGFSTLLPVRMLSAVLQVSAMSDVVFHGWMDGWVGAVLFDVVVGTILMVISITRFVIVGSCPHLSQ